MIRLKLFGFAVKMFALISQGKCKFYGICELRNVEQRACTKDRGQYYGWGRYPGCYRTLEEMRN